MYSVYADNGGSVQLVTGSAPASFESRPDGQGTIASLYATVCFPISGVSSLSNATHAAAACNVGPGVYENNPSTVFDLFSDDGCTLAAGTWVGNYFSNAPSTCSSPQPGQVPQTGSAVTYCIPNTAYSIAAASMSLLVVLSVVTATLLVQRGRWDGVRLSRTRFECLVLRRHDPEMLLHSYLYLQCYYPTAGYPCI